MPKIEASIGYEFKSEALLRQALTHRSFGDNNNERLEFLGDAILSFVIAAALYEKFPDSSEGDLSRLRARLVKQEPLADIAREIQLGDALIMGSGELKSGGFNRDSILSDALEAVFGAVFLDSGIDAATLCISGLFATRLMAMNANDLRKDPKTQLQEYLQGVSQALPEYQLIATRGKSPREEFEVACHVSLFDQPVTAKGTSRRKAEQQAAAAALKILKVDA